MTDLIYEDESYDVLGACFEVYNEKGPGFLEPVYHECLEIELQLQEIPHEREELFKLSYKGHQLTQQYEPDFICFAKIILEVKALSKLTSDHEAQVLNYLKATDKKVGLLANFGSPEELEYRRIVL